MFSINIFAPSDVGDNNCASVWSFSYTSTIENADGVVSGDFSNQTEHENLHQDPWIKHGMQLSRNFLSYILLLS